MIQVVAFLVIGLVSMGTMAVVLPLGEGPDEPAHIVRAAGLLRGQVLGRRAIVAHPADGEPIQVAGYDVNTSYVDVIEIRPRRPDGSMAPITRDGFERERALPWRDATIFAEASNTASYAPILYAPSSAAMGVAHWLQWSPHDAVLAGRFMNLVVYLGLGAAAVALAGSARAFVSAMLLLPMSVFLGSCVGQDGVIIALAAVGMVCLGRSEGDGPLFWGAVAAFALIVVAKPPYAPLCLLLLIGRGRLRVRLAGLALPIGLAAGWAMLAASRATVAFWRPAYRPGPLYAGGEATFRSTDPAAQLGLLLDHPARLLTLPIQTLRDTGSSLLEQAVGILSWLDLPLPPWLYRFWYAALAVAAVAMLARAGAARGRPRRGRDAAVAAAVVFVVVVTTWLIFVAQYASWTQVGGTQIDGVQGRYLIPVAMALVLLVRIEPRPAGALAASVVLSVSVLSSIAVAYLVIARYYLH